MGKEIDSAALTLLNRILGLSGVGGAPRTEIEDGLVSLVMDINPVVRRSRTIVPSEGIYYFRFSFTHGAADTQDEYLDPYDPGAAAIRGYPFSVPKGYDLWILGCGGQVDVTANFTEGYFALNIPPENCGVGISQIGGLSTPGIVNLPLVGFTAIQELGVGKFLSNSKTDSIYFPLGMRIRRGCRLYLETVSSGAVVVSFTVVTCLLPSGLGQDVIT